MTPRKLNCWEYMNCQREPGGKNAAELGECVAAIDSSFDGINLRLETSRRRGLR